jgi:hypothetical protein
MNIHPDRRGYRVIVQRCRVLYKAFVPYGPGDLQRATRLRDRFLATVGAVATRSNTGIRGICETTQYQHGRAFPCFSVTAHSRTTRFGIVAYGTRRQALRAAAAWRSRHTGQRITTAQIEEALNHV